MQISKILQGAIIAIIMLSIMTPNAGAVWMGEGASICPADVMCATANNPGTPIASKIVTMVIWPHTVNKNSESTEQVFRVKEGVSGPWKRFSSQIEGFHFTPGHAYMLKVQKDRGIDSVTRKISYKYTALEVLKDVNVVPNLANTQWKVESVWEYKVQLDTPVTFGKNGEFSAKICNSISGTYKQNNDKIQIDAISTLMMCNSPSMPLETAINQADTVYDIIGGKLHIRTSYGVDSVLVKIK